MAIAKDIVPEFYRLRDKILESQYIHLNDMQKKAILTTQGPLLVLAGAGSGKTTVLVNRIAHLIKFGCAYGSQYVPRTLTGAHLNLMKEYIGQVESGNMRPLPNAILPLLQYRPVFPGNILAITFTNKAAREMKDRVIDLVGDSAYDIWISTFHSTCVRILRRNIDKIEYSRNFAIYDDVDQLSLLKDCIKELNLNEKYYQPKDMRNSINRLKDQMKDPSEYMKEVEGQFREKSIANIYRIYEAKMKQNNALDFADLINKTLELFNRRPDVVDFYRKKFQYILVDEYQDTNLAQYTFVKMLSELHKNICAVGDDDQSIYGWRGADIRNILEFEKDFTDTKVVKLEENYRSSQNILDAANSVIKNNRGRKPKRLWTQSHEGSKVQIYRATTEKDEAEYVCRKISKLIQEEGMGPGDFAVLYRVNAQSRVLEEALMKYGIQYKIYGGLRFYDRKEIKDIISYLRLIANPNDDVSLKRIINAPRRGIGSVTVETLEKAAAIEEESIFNIIIDLDKNQALTGRTTARVMEFGHLITRLIAMNGTMGLTDFIYAVLNETGYQENLEQRKTPEDLSRLENIKEFVSAAKEFEAINEEADLVDFLENIALISDIDQMDEQQTCVALMTLHSAKGLEFPIVFLVGLEEGLFPLSRSIDNYEELEEERRLCYVGITRAKRRLHLSYAMNRTLYGNSMENMPSRFLREIPEELLEPVEISTTASFHGMGTKGSNRIPSSVDANKKSSSRFSFGDKVVHSRFGAGTIVAMSGEGSDARISIAFEQGGIKTFMAELAPLKRL